MQTVNGFSAVLKELYIGTTRDQINAKTNLLDLMTKADVSHFKWEGKYAIYTLHSGRNAGVKAVSENGQLPTAGAQQYQKLQIPMQFVYGRIQITAQIMKASVSNKGSFIRAMESEQSDLVKDVARQRNRYLAGAGHGILALVSSIAGNVVTFKNPGGVTGTTNSNRYFLTPSGAGTGQQIAFHVSNTTVLRGVATVISVSSNGNDVTFDAAPAGVVANDVVTIGQSSNGIQEGSLDIEPMGLLGLADATTYVSTIFGLDRSLDANFFFRSQVLSSIGVPSMDVIQRGVDNTEEVSGSLIKTFVAHSSTRRELLKLTENDKRYPVQSGQVPNLDPGNQAGTFKTDMTINNWRVRIDKDIPYGTLFGIDPSRLAWIPEVEGEWADEDGKVLLRAGNQDNYEGRYRIFENFFCDQGNALIRFDGITTTVTAGIRSL